MLNLLWDYHISEEKVKTSFCWVEWTTSYVCFNIRSCVRDYSRISPQTNAGPPIVSAIIIAMMVSPASVHVSDKNTIFVDLLEFHQQPVWTFYSYR